MTKKEYAQEVANALGGTVREVEKINGVVLVGVMRNIEVIDNVNPTVYIDDLYNDNVPIDEAVKICEQRLVECPIPQSLEIFKLTDFDAIRDNVRCALYNKATNSEVNISAEPYGFDDLIIEPYVIMGADDKYGLYTARVTKSMLERWGKSVDYVIEIGLANSGADIKVASLNELLGIPDIPGTVSTYILSNQMNIRGAICAVLAQDKLWELFPDGFIVIPSSIHEVLVMPYQDEYISQHIDEMIVNVNSAELKATDVLGTKCYTFKK